MHLCARARTRYGSRFPFSSRCISARLLANCSQPCPLQSADGRVTQGYYITAYRNLTSVSAFTNANHPGDG
jgi:hypothetical protein